MLKVIYLTIVSNIAQLFQLFQVGNPLSTILNSLYLKPPLYYSEFNFPYTENGFQLVPKTFSVAFLSGFYSQSTAHQYQAAYQI